MSIIEPIVPGGIFGGGGPITVVPGPPLGSSGTSTGVSVLILKKICKDEDFDFGLPLVSLHTGPPGLEGDNEVTGGSYARQSSIGWNVAFEGVSTTTSAIEWTSGFPLVTVTHAGLWSEDGLIFISGIALDLPKTITTGSARFAAGSLRYSVSDRFSDTLANLLLDYILLQTPFTVAPVFGSIHTGALTSVGGSEVSSGGAATIAPLAGATGATGSNTSTTTPNVNTTGADLLVAVLAYYNVDEIPALSDSMGNTWVAVQAETVTAGGLATRMFYVLNPATNATHTFTAASTLPTYTGLAVEAFSGVLAFDDSSAGAATSSATTLQPGSLTPAGDNQLLVSGLALGLFDSSQAIGSSFSLLQDSAGSSGFNFAVSLAGKVQTSGGAENPSWTWATNAGAASQLAAFTAAGGYARQELAIADWAESGILSAGDTLLSLLYGVTATWTNVPITSEARVGLWDSATLGNFLMWGPDLELPATSVTSEANEIAAQLEQTP